LEFIKELGGRTWVGLKWLKIEMGSGPSRERKKAVSSDYVSSTNLLYSGVSKCSEIAPKSDFLRERALMRRDTIK